MKLARYGFLVLLFSLILVSCSDDKVANPDEEEVQVPNGKITLITSVNGEEVESKTIERIDDEFVPELDNFGGYYNKGRKSFGLTVTSSSSTLMEYMLSFNSYINELKVGNYTFTSENEEMTNSAYFSTKYSENTYTATAVTLNLTKVKFIGDELLGSYYITGTMSIDLKNVDEEDTYVTIDATFSEMEILKINFVLE